MKKIVLILLTFSSYLYSQVNLDNITDYYKNKEYDKALLNLQDIELNESNMDDAYYLLGKIYQEKKDYSKALIYFEKIINNYPKSGKKNLSILNSARIFNIQKEWKKTINLIKDMDLTSDKSNNNKLLSLYGYASYRQSLMTKHLDKRKYITIGIKSYETVIPRTNRTKDKITLAKLYAYQLKSDPDNTELKAKFDKLYTELKRLKVKSSTIKYIDKIKATKERKGKTSINIDLMGAYSEAPSFYGDFNIKKSIPVNRDLTLKLAGEVEYDPFTYKSFNFADKYADDRHIQWSLDTNGTIYVNKGDKNSFYNSLYLNLKFTNAENNEDNAFSFRLKDSLSVRPNSLLAAKVEATAGYTQYPNYLVNGNKIDYLLGRIKPGVDLHVNDFVYVSVDNEFTYKGYTQATYNDPDKDRYYLINNPAIGINIDTKKVDFGIKFNYEVLNSFNYDKEINATSETKLIKAYGDYLEPKLTGKITVKPTKKLKIITLVSYAMRDYQNSEARTADNEFTGDLREDKELNISFNANYKLSNKVKIIGEYNLINEESNMKYDKYFVTNLDYQTIFLGVSLNL